MATTFTALHAQVFLDGSHRPMFMENFKEDQMRYADATALQLQTKWHPAALRLFLAPPPDPYLDALVQQSNLLFRAVRVQMTRQVRLDGASRR